MLSPRRIIFHPISLPSPFHPRELPLSRSFVTLESSSFSLRISNCCHFYLWQLVPSLYLNPTNAQMELPQIPNTICIAKKQSQTLVRVLLDLIRAAGVWSGAELNHPLRQGEAAGGSASTPLAAASTAMKTARYESPYLSFRIER